MIETSRTHREATSLPHLHPCFAVFCERGLAGLAELVADHAQHSSELRSPPGSFYPALRLMTVRLPYLGAALAVALAFHPLAARADQAEDEAAALMNAAADAYQKGDYGTCRDKANQAWTKFQHAQISGLLGSCEVKLGMYSEGATHLDFYLKSTTDQPNPDAKQLFEEAKQHVSEVTLACHPEGVIFKIDGKPLGTGSSTVFLTPGQHVVSAEKQGYETKQAPESVAAGAKMTVNIQLEPVKVHMSPIPGIVTLSVGVVALAVGGGLLGLHASQLADGRVQAGKMPACPTAGPGPVGGDCTKLDNQAKAATTSGNAGAGLLIAGGVVAAAGVGLLAWELVGGAPKSTERNSVYLVPAIGKHEQGFVVGGSF